LATPTDYASFLVRLWRKSETDAANGTGDWQGEVEHIQSNQCRTFATLDELLSILRRQAGEPGLQELPKGK
jgi:hypothetical protein